MTMYSKALYVVDGARTPFLKSKNRPGPFAASDLATQAGRTLLMRQPFEAQDLDVERSLADRADGCDVGSARELDRDGPRPRPRIPGRLARQKVEAVLLEPPRHLRSRHLTGHRFSIPRVARARFIALHPRHPSGSQHHASDRTHCTGGAG